MVSSGDEDEIGRRDGSFRLAEVTLGKGDAKAAEDAIAQLEKVSPSAVDLPQFKQRLASLKASNAEGVGYLVSRIVAAQPGAR